MCTIQAAFVACTTKDNEAGPRCRLRWLAQASEPSREVDTLRCSVQSILMRVRKARSFNIV